MTTSPAVETDRKRAPLQGQLWFQVVVATVIGIVVGHFWPDVGAAMKPFGDAFIALIRMMIAPIIFCTVVHGLGSMRDMASFGRLALRALIYFELVTTLALIFGLVAVNLWRPGVGMNVNPAQLDTEAVAAYVATARGESVAGYLLHIIPRTFASAFTEGEVLQVLLVSVLAGIAFAALGEKARPAMVVIESLTGVFFRIVHYIMYLAPIGAFGAIAFTVGRFGFVSLVSLGHLIIAFFAICAVFTVVVFGLIARSVGVSLLRLIAYIRDELVIVAATTATETVLPRLMQKLTAMGCEERVVGFVVPAGYSFNLDGTCLYLATVTIFLAQATNTDLSLWQQLGLLAVLLLTSKGAAGVPGAAFVVLAATLSTTGIIPLASIALILGIQRILAEGLTFVNVVGNSLATIVLSLWEGAVDRDRLMECVGTSRARRRLAQAPRPT